jgi:hypothetical protein
LKYVISRHEIYSLVGELSTGFYTFVDLLNENQELGKSEPKEMSLAEFTRLWRDAEKRLIGHR